MLIRVGYDILFEHPAPTPMIAMLYLHPYHTPRIGRVLMAYGHDAADVALLTSFGPSRLDRIKKS